MKEETELFFDSIMREDRSVMDLLNADYTFVNERLARHYGIPNIYGSQFRRVQVPSEARRGLLGQASILTVTSYPNRTSPVERGKWVLTNLLGVPPQPPPPNIPPLPRNGADGKVLSLRERMEAHRANPVCAGCHRVMDPIGFCDGELRRHRPLAREGRRRSPSTRRARCSPARKMDGVTALRRKLVEPPGCLRRRHHGEDADLRASAAASSTTTCPRCGRSSRMRRATNYRFSSIVLGVVRSVPFQMKETAVTGKETR